jgi:hypothetical protein
MDTIGGDSQLNPNDADVRFGSKEASSGQQSPNSEKVPASIIELAELSIVENLETSKPLLQNNGYIKKSLTSLLMSSDQT